MKSEKVQVIHRAKGHSRFRSVEPNHDPENSTGPGGSGKGKKFVSNSLVPPRSLSSWFKAKSPWSSERSPEIQAMWEAPEMSEFSPKKHPGHGKHVLKHV